MLGNVEQSNGKRVASLNTQEGSDLVQRQEPSENHRERRRVVTEAQSLTSNLAAQHLKFRGQGGVQTNK